MVTLLLSLFHIHTYLGTYVGTTSAKLILRPVPILDISDWKQRQPPLHSLLLNHSHFSLSLTLALLFLPPGTNTIKLFMPQLNYGKILMHCVRCSVSFQVNIFVLASKD